MYYYHSRTRNDPTISLQVSPKVCAQRIMEAPCDDSGAPILDNIKINRRLLVNGWHCELSSWQCQILAEAIDGLSGDQIKDLVSALKNISSAE